MSQNFSILSNDTFQCVDPSALSNASGPAQCEVDAHTVPTPQSQQYVSDLKTLKPGNWTPSNVIVPNYNITLNGGQES